MGNHRPAYFFYETTILQVINVKNVHLVPVAGIWSHNIFNMSLIPLPLDQDSYGILYTFN